MRFVENLKDTVKSEKFIVNDARVLAIDPASHSIAFSVMRGNKNNVDLIAIGKITFPKGSTTSSRAKIINASIPELISKYKIDTVVIEETIYIQNPNTTRILAYTVGSLWGKAIDMDVRVIDVGPLKWKAFINYKNVKKAEIVEWTKTMGEREAKKKASFERKDRVRSIMFEKYPKVDEEDYDIWDSIAIGWWAIHNCYEYKA
jgi:Holliday junction resolvasome RuvABC endonuclease subunit